MSHVPLGYRIENGKAIIDEKSAEQIKTLFQSYLSGDSLRTAARKAGIGSFHGGVCKILQNARYLGDAYYPAIIDSDTLAAAEAERIKRATRLGRIREPEEKAEIIFPTAFRFLENPECVDEQADLPTSPFQQAEYVYSLIESEVS
ncbi:hypothetical protein BRE01_17320 [Brevibacillus reuszeri]|uniref:Recombinase n=1 Tax=Brevibacillus reuszeri TaxID=54915 RepID=A0A0K9Z098_9BACL|nr:recombinase [Brevibacillus reuszeri]KNB74374.1 recombinase [Brevibacillus reuszeri]MED1856281.1 recombinase [Brevibacillus reuszeri]GED68030.1 hypothetical protein BRE01_17320 [Brevibacillus reuszeri]